MDHLRYHWAIVTLEHWINAYDKDLRKFTLLQIWYTVDLFLFPPPTTIQNIPSRLRTDFFATAR